MGLIEVAAIAGLAAIAAYKWAERKAYRNAAMVMMLVKAGVVSINDDGTVTRVDQNDWATAQRRAAPHQ